MVQGVLGWDRAFFLWVYHHGHHPWLDPLMLFFSEGNKWWSVRLGLLLLWLYLLWRGGQARLFALWLIPLLGVSNEISDLLKGWVGRSRPGVELAIQPLVGSLTSGSFPSAHAMNTAAVLGLALVFFGRRAWGWLGWLPLLVGFSRVYVGVHYPLDVIAGWAIGGVMGFGGGWGFKRVKRGGTPASMGRETPPKIAY